MADEKLNPSQGEQINLDISGASPAPDLTSEGPARAGARQPCCAGARRCGGGHQQNRRAYG